MIVSRGCRHLVRGKWDNLKSLYFGINRFDVENNKMQSKGCEELAKAVWNEMKSVWLGMYSEMQMMIEPTGRA